MLNRGDTEDVVKAMFGTPLSKEEKKDLEKCLKKRVGEECAGRVMSASVTDVLNNLTVRDIADMGIALYKEEKKD